MMFGFSMRTAAALILLESLSGTESQTNFMVIRIYMENVEGRLRRPRIVRTSEAPNNSAT
jgi:hypothetical protein